MKPKINPKETEWKCPVCNWQGTIEEMTSDTISGENDEILAEYVCPKCLSWNNAKTINNSDWIEVTE